MCKAVSSETETLAIKNRRLEQHLPFAPHYNASHYKQFYLKLGGEKLVNQGN